MSRYGDHLTLPDDQPFVPRVARPRSRSPIPLYSPGSEEEGLPVFNFMENQNTRPLSSLSLQEIDSIRRESAAAAAAPPPVTMSLTPEQLANLTSMMEAQQKQIDEMKIAAEQQHNSLIESQRQLHASQGQVQQLTDALTALSTQPRQQQPHRKKPDLPPFDAKNIIIWIRRLKAAYDRAGVTLAQDKFAYLEATFPVKQNARIDAFLYGTNTEQDWNDFLDFLLQEYGPTIRQKACKLIGDIPRHDTKPSEYLAQLDEDIKDVTIDHLKREHLLKTIPPRIREIMGKEVEQMTAAEVAKMADDFFDRNGRPLEKANHTVNNVYSSHSAASTTAATTASSLTAAFEDPDDTDVNFVRRGNSQGNRRRSQSRGFRSNSRPPNSSSSSSTASTASSSSFPSKSPTVAPGTCRWHRRFGNKSTKCVSDCPLHQSFISQQRRGSGNGQGGRRM